MEIIARGRIPREREAEFSCFECNSRLKAKINEAVREDKYSDFRDSWDNLIFICPVCSKEISVDRKRFV